MLRLADGTSNKADWPFEDVLKVQGKARVTFTFTFKLTLTFAQTA